MPQLGLAKSKEPKKAASHTCVCSTRPLGLFKLLQIRPEGKRFALCLFKVGHEGRRRREYLPQAGFGLSHSQVGESGCTPWASHPQTTSRPTSVGTSSLWRLGDAQCCLRPRVPVPWQHSCVSQVTDSPFRIWQHLKNNIFLIASAELIVIS